MAALVARAVNTVLTSPPQTQTIFAAAPPPVAVPPSEEAIAALLNECEATRRARDAPRLLAAIASLLQTAPDDQRIVRPLINILADAAPLPSLLRGRVFVVLAEHLWRFSDADVLLVLDPTRWKVLCRFVTSRPALAHPETGDAATDLMVAICKLFATSGDKNAVRTLRRLGRMRAYTLNECTVRGVARECLVLLKETRQKQTALLQELTPLLGEVRNAPLNVQGLENFVQAHGTDASKAALVRFLRLEQKREQKQRISVASVCLIVLFIAEGFLGIWYRLSMIDWSQSADWYCFSGIRWSRSAGLSVAFLPFVIGLFALFMLHTASSASLRAAAVLGWFSDVRLLPFVLDTARSADKPDALQAALCRLLPLLRPGDAALFSPRHKSLVRHSVDWRFLSPYGASPLVVAALDALAVLNDQRALPRVQILARRIGNVTIREAAIRCADALTRQNKKSG